MGFMGFRRALLSVLCLTLLNQQSCCDEVTNAGGEHKHLLELVAHENDTVIIPCFNRNHTLLIWEINGVTYPVHLLPPRLKGVSNGLVVHYITSQDKGSYSCYGSSSVHGFKLFSSTEFEVKPRPVQASPDSRTYLEPQVENYGTELYLSVTERDIFYIPCLPVTGSDVALLWEIDGWLYPDLKLPSQLYPHYGGIVAYNASQSHLGTKYVCHTIENDVPKRYTVNLQVSESPTPINFPPSKDEDLNLSSGEQHSHYFSASPNMTARNVVLQAKQKNFGFALPDDDSCSNTLHSRSTLSDWTDSTNNSIVEVPSSEFVDKDAFIESYTTYPNGTVCKRFRAKYRVEASETTQKNCTHVGDDACIDVGQYFRDRLTLYAKWPEQPDSNNDCLCLVSMVLPFERCYCFQNNLTEYNVTLNGTQLCWRNLSQSTNVTSIIILNPTDSKEWHIKQHRKVFAQGPAPNMPNVTQDPDSSWKIHIQSHSANEWNPILRTEVVTQDITRDTIQNIDKQEEDFSIDFAGFPRSCAPYHFTITSETECTMSPPATFESEETGNVCDCLKEKFEITASVDRTTTEEIYLNLDINCLHLGPNSTYNIHEVSNLYAQTECISPGKSTLNLVPIRPAPCDSQTTVYIHNLKPGTGYNISIIWMSASVCQVSSTLQHIFTKTYVNLPLIIGGSTAGGLIGVAVLIIVILCILCRRKMRRWCTCHRTRESSTYAVMRGENRPTINAET